MADFIPPTLHEDLALFQEAVNYTAARTGFSSRLIDKDYFCTVLLAYLSQHVGDQLVFKGGTCLAKVHAGFYRLSEDLDFTISMPAKSSRAQCRQAVASLKNAVTQITNHAPVFVLSGPLTGSNKSPQYNGVLSYASPTTGQSENILIEMSVREPLLLPPIVSDAQTMLLDPRTGTAMVPALALNCMAWQEAIAEKFRAALSRKDIAIRDFYDLDYAVRHLGLNVHDSQVVELVRQKLAIPGNLPVNLNSERLDLLKRQLGARLKTVLRNEEFIAFDLDRAIQWVMSMAEQVQ